MTDDNRRKGPVLIDYTTPAPEAVEAEQPRIRRRAAPRIEAADTAPPSPAEAPPVMDAPEDLDALPPDGRAMRVVSALMARRESLLSRWFWRVGFALAGFVLSLMAWRWIAGLMAAYPLLGWIAAGLTGLFLLLAAGLALRELAAFSRLRRLDTIHKAAVAALASTNAKDARAVVADLDRLYAARPDLDWPRARLAERLPDAPDALGALHLAEAELMAPLDAAARIEIEAAARTVATVTALVPLALADVFAALAANLRMIRRIAEIYGGRAGSFGSWRLARTVLTHLVATGAVAAGDDLIETMAGGGLLSKLSRRFGEGVVNGALTARVGIAAMEVCRPLPFVALDRPKVGNLVKRAVTGLFDRAR